MESSINTDDKPWMSCKLLQFLNIVEGLGVSLFDCDIVALYTVVVPKYPQLCYRLEYRLPEHTQHGNSNDSYFDVQ